MKTKLNAGILALALGYAGSSLATPMNIADNYYGGNDHGYGDVIGSDSKFGIDSMDVDISGNILSVTINTAFGGRGDDGEFAAYTYDKGIGYGDLFLSSAWTPYSPATPAGSDNYIEDDNSNGTIWTYGFALEDRWMAEDTPGNGALFKLNAGNNDANALLSDDFITNATFRNGQEVAVDQTSDISFISRGTWSTTSGSVTFTIDLTGTELANSPTIALHWGMTCGNDTIEGEYTRSVPAPGISGLLAIGLLGLAAARKRKQA